MEKMEKNIIIRLSIEDHKNLKRLCLEKDISIQSLISGFVKKEIEKFTKKGGRKKSK